MTDIELISVPVKILGSNVLAMLTLSTEFTKTISPNAAIIPTTWTADHVAIARAVLMDGHASNPQPVEGLCFS